MRTYEGDRFDQLWPAFCTIYWAATGVKVVSEDTSTVGVDMYNWFLRIMDKIDAELEYGDWDSLLTDPGC